MADGQDIQVMSDASIRALIAPSVYAENTGMHLENVFFVWEVQKPESIRRIKELITRYGAAMLYVNGNILMQRKAVDFYRGNTWGTYNHFVSLIGWDDEYDFAQSGLRIKPKEKGAWIIRNSWGTDWADKGDAYISYEDGAIRDVYSLDVDLYGESFDYIMTHEDVAHLENSRRAWQIDVEMPENAAFAASYTAAEDALLTEVGFYAGKDGMSYAIDVYKDCQDFLSSRPTASRHQEGVLGEDGTPDNLGYRVVKLLEPVPLSAGEEYAVEVSLKSPDGETVFCVAFETDEFPADEVRSYINEGDGQWQKVLNQKGKYKNRIFQASSVIQRIYLKRR